MMVDQPVEYLTKRGKGGCIQVAISWLTDKDRVRRLK